MKFFVNDNQINDDDGQGNESLFKMLDRGIDDMEEARELSLNEAFQKINELRDARRKRRVE